jgi:hypothetical protein
MCMVHLRRKIREHSICVPGQDLVQKAQLRWSHSPTSRRMPHNGLLLGDTWTIHQSYPLSTSTQFGSHCCPLLILYFTVSSTTLFPVLSKLTISILSFEDLTDNSNDHLHFKPWTILNVVLRWTWVASWTSQSTSATEISIRYNGFRPTLLFRISQFSEREQQHINFTEVEKACR